MKKLFAVSLLLGLIFFFCGCSLLYEGQNNALDNETLAKIVAENLGVPDDAVVEVEISEVFYWEAAERDFKTVTFTENGEMVACADVDPCTGELLKGIYKYDGQ